jgi:lipopolysaccharide export system permease protein
MRGESLFSGFPPQPFLELQYSMRRPLVIHRHIFFELWQPFGVTVLALCALLVMTQMLDLGNYIVNHRVGVGAVGLLVLYTLPYLLTFILPMATMLAVLLTFLSLSAQNGITALKAGGMSLYRLIWPVALFCAITAGLTGFMMIKGLVWGRMATKVLLADVVAGHIDIGLEERTFLDRFEGVVLYVNEVDKSKRLLKHVFIEDRRTPGVTSVITARSGALLSAPDKSLWVLRLENGVLNQVDAKAKTVYETGFETYDLRVNLVSRLFAHDPGGPKDEEEMSLAELVEFLNTRQERDDLYWLAKLQFHKKFSLPFACMVLGLLSVPLGVVSRSARRSFGVILALVFFLFYYLILVAGEVFGEAGVYPPAIGMWMPNIILAAVAFPLWRSAATDRPFAPVEKVGAFLRRRARKKAQTMGAG